MGIHYTISYRNNMRIISNIGNRQHLSIGVLMRKYIFHPSSILSIIKSEYGLILGSLFWPLLFLSIFTPYIFIKIVFGFFLLVDFLSGLIKEPEYLIGRFISHYVFPIYVLLGFLFYFPKPKKVEWKKIC